MRRPRFLYRPRKDFLADGLTCSFDIGGEATLQLAQVFAPTMAEVRRMLIELRSRAQWSQARLAAVLGASKATVRGWENGTRNPSGAARKLIWMVHRNLFQPKEPFKDVLDFALWGHSSSKEADLGGEHGGSIANRFPN